MNILKRTSKLIKYIGYNRNSLQIQSLTKNQKFGFSKKDDFDFEKSINQIKNNPDLLKQFQEELSQKESKEQEQDNQDDEDSYINQSKKGYYAFIIASVTLVGGYCVLQLNSMGHQKKKQQVKVTSQGKADIGGPFQLLDLDGNVFTEQDLAGSYYLIYFGFCNCPDICPMSMHKLSKALERIKKMPEARFIKLKNVFVSVDPDRDSPQKIKDFLALFKGEFIGLTAKSNNDQQLKDCMRKFKIYASKIEYEEEDDEAKEKSKDSETKFKNAYTIDHTIITYLMDDQNNYVNFLGSNLSEYDLATQIVENCLQNERDKIRKF